jgi:HEAT repeat protein
VGSSVVEDILDEPDAQPPEFVALACAAAGLLDDTSLVRPLTGLARDGDQSPVVRSAAITALARIADPSATHALVGLLDAEDIEARRAAAAGLGYLTHPGQQAVIDRIAEAALQDRDAPTRHLAAISLGRIGGPEVHQQLVDALDHGPRAEMRPWLALALGLCARTEGNAGPEVTERLVALASGSGNAESSGAYLVALGLTRSSAAIPVLVDALQHGSSRLAGHAALALALTADVDAAAPLREALISTPSPFVSRQAALGLGVLGDTSAIPQLVELMRTTNHPYVASYAALGLAYMGEPAAAGPLLALIEEQDGHGIRASYAAAAVGQLLDRHPRPALSRLASGDNYFSRANALEGLLALGF